MICDFLASFSRDGKKRPAHEKRRVGAPDPTVLRDPSSVGHPPDTFSHKGRRETLP